MAELSAGDAKLIHYLNEAYGLEKRLETALQAHIAMTVKATYKKRLKEHLSETKRHGREVKQRIKQLGGTAETMSAPGPEPIAEAAQAVLSGAQKAVAFTQGPCMHCGEPASRRSSSRTQRPSTPASLRRSHLHRDRDARRNARRQGYSTLARTIRREEERMRAFLEKEIPRLTKAVAKEEIPASERPTSTRAKPPAGKNREGADNERTTARRHHYELNYTPPNTESGRRLARR
jgi:Domain of unknown function (DUF892)